MNYVAETVREGVPNWLSKSGALTKDVKRAFTATSKDGVSEKLKANLFDPAAFEIQPHITTDDEALTAAQAIVADSVGDFEKQQAELGRLAEIVLANHGFPKLASFLKEPVLPEVADQVAAHEQAA